MFRWALPVTCASGDMHFLVVIVHYVMITCFLLILPCNFIRVTWGDCPLITVMCFLLSWQLVDNPFRLVAAFLRCNCSISFLGFNWFLSQRWFYVQELLLRQNLPATAVLLFLTAGWLKVVYEDINQWLLGSCVKCESFWRNYSSEKKSRVTINANNQMKRGQARSYAAAFEAMPATIFFCPPQFCAQKILFFENMQ